MVEIGSKIKKNKILKNDWLNVKFCPNCRGFEVKYVFGMRNFFGISPKMKCSGCNFEMPSFPILQITQENLDKVIIKMKKKTSVGVVKKVGKKIGKKNKTVVKPKMKNKIKGEKK